MQVLPPTICFFLETLAFELKFCPELNILTCTRPEMKSTFHHTLISLAVVDNLFILTIIIDIQRFDLNLDNQLFILFFPYFWNPFKNILMTFETYLMMSISTERYMAIIRPIEYRVRKVKQKAGYA